MTLEANTIEMSDAQYRMFCTFIREHCGLHFGADTRFLVERRVARRLESSGINSFGSYLYHLRSASPGDDELSQLVDDLTTNETYFFREMRQLRALMQEIVPEFLDRRRARGIEEPISIWSAGCSSGEEAYTIAMLALEAGLEPRRDLRIYASDISRKMLRKARHGLYREASFRDTPALMRSRYFQRKDSLYQICDDVKRNIDLIHLNLLDQQRSELLGRMDVVLCRNVIIYFDADTKKRVIEGFYQKLKPGGYLLLGHSESLISISSAFEICHLANDLVYRKPMPGEERNDPWHRLTEQTLGSDEEAWGGGQG